MPGPVPSCDPLQRRQNGGGKPQSGGEGKTFTLLIAGPDFLTKKKPRPRVEDLEGLGERYVEGVIEMLAFGRSPRGQTGARSDIKVKGGGGEKRLPMERFRVG